LAGSAVSVPVSTETDDGHRAILAALSLASQSRFPESRGWLGVLFLPRLLKRRSVMTQDDGSGFDDGQFSYIRAESVEGSLRSQAGHSHSVGASPVDGCLDEVGREEGERDRHVHLPHTAALTSGDALDIRSGVGNEFVEPTAAPCNRCDQDCAVLGTDGGGRLEAVRLRARELRGVGLMVSCATALRSRYGFASVWDRHLLRWQAR
jgi:hypothetical protein